MRVEEIAVPPLGELKSKIASISQTGVAQVSELGGGKV